MSDCSFQERTGKKGSKRWVELCDPVTGTKCRKEGFQSFAELRALAQKELCNMVHQQQERRQRARYRRDGTDANA